jgi:hypothetical protein
LENIVLIASNYYNQADINSQIDWNKQIHTETPNTNELLNMMLDLNNSYSDNQPDHHNNSFAQNQNNDIQSSNSFNIFSQTQEILNNETCVSKLPQRIRNDKTVQTINILQNPINTINQDNSTSNDSINNNGQMIPPTSSG